MTLRADGGGAVIIGSTPISGGADTQVLFNDGGFVGGDAGLVYNKTTDVLTAAGGFRPAANDGAPLGSATVSFADLFLASGGVINWNNGDVTATHAANTLTFAGATTAYEFDSGGTSKMMLGPWSAAATYNAISLNGSLVATGLLGMFGLGTGGDLNLYFNVPTGGAYNLRVNNTNTFLIGLDGSSGFLRLGADADYAIIKEAQNVHASRGGTDSQTYRWYDTYTSSTDYHRVAIKTARATLSAMSGATVTATNLIPDGAIVIGVTTKVTTLIEGASGYQVGDGSDADRWGDSGTGVAAGTTTDNRDWTATTVQAFTSANNVVITAKTSNFTAGAMYVSVQYLIGECD